MIQNASTAGYADSVRKVVVRGFHSSRHAATQVDRSHESYDEKELRCCILVQNAWRSIQARRNFAALKQAAVCKDYRESHPENVKIRDPRDPSKYIHRVVVRNCKACGRDNEAAVLREKLDRALYSEVYNTLFENHLRISVQDTGDNWNERFQLALAMPENTQADRILKYKCMSSLNSDFLSSATTYAKIIISEHFLHAKDKCISESSRLGGEAGGTKYIWRGILFKLADGNTGPWNGCDESAAKGAAHDLKGLNHYFAASSGDINVPLMALIDYKGFRMTAQAVLPLGANSLIYGSNDAGRTVHRDPRFHDAMHKIADKLNLRAHFVGRTGELKELHSAVDIEGHKGDDGRLYILDLARAFPPEAPEKTKHLNGLYPNGSRVLIPIPDPNRPGTQLEVSACVIRAYESGSHYDVVMNVPNSDRRILVEQVPSKHITDSRISIFHRLLRPEYVKTRGIDLVPLDPRDYEGPYIAAPILPPPPPPTASTLSASAADATGYGAFGSDAAVGASSTEYSAFGGNDVSSSPPSGAAENRNIEPFPIEFSGYNAFSPNNISGDDTVAVSDREGKADGVVCGSSEGPSMKSYDGYEYFGSMQSGNLGGYSAFSEDTRGGSAAVARKDSGGRVGGDLGLPTPPAKTARRSPVALSADALTSFSRNDPEAYIRNREVADATERLILKVIPRLAKQLEEMTPETFNQIDDLGAYIHSYGVNMRHLGVLRYNVCSATEDGINVRRYLLLQIVGRTLKNILRDFQRRWMKSERSTSEQGMFNLIAHFFNLIVGSHRKSESFWRDQVIVGIIQRFGRIAFTNDEEQENLQDICSEPTFLKELVFFVSKSVGIVIVPLTVQQFADTEDPYGYTFSIHDILELVPKTRNMHIVDFQIGKLLQMLGEGVSEEDGQLIDVNTKGTEDDNDEDNKVSLLLERLNLFAASKLRIAERSLPGNREAWHARQEVEQRLNQSGRYPYDSESGYGNSNRRFPTSSASAAARSSSAIIGGNDDSAAAADANSATNGANASQQPGGGSRRNIKSMFRRKGAKRFSFTGSMKSTCKQS